MMPFVHLFYLLFVCIVSVSLCAPVRMSKWVSSPLPAEVEDECSLTQCLPLIQEPSVSGKLVKEQGPGSICPHGIRVVETCLAFCGDTGN